MAHNLLVVGLSDHCFNLTVSQDIQVGALKKWLAKRQGSVAAFHLTLGGEPLRNSDVIPCSEDWGTTLIRAHPILCGGKGGFGALIRAVGNRINRSYNNEACRDLSGRRLRDINAEKKVSKWLEEEPQRKKKLREEKRKRVMHRRTQPKHFFDDQGYMKQLRANEEEMDDALKQGLVASSKKGLKRKQPQAKAGPSSMKKTKLWVGLEEEADSTGSDDDGESGREQEEGETSTDSETPQKQKLNSSSSGSSNGSSDKSRGLVGEGIGMECTPGPSGLHPNSTTSTTGETHTAVVSVEVHVENSSTKQVDQLTLEQGSKTESQEVSSGTEEEIGREESREEEPVGAVGRGESGEEEPVGAVGRGESGGEEPVGTVGRGESGGEEPVGAVGRGESGEEEPVGAVGRGESGEEEPVGAVGRGESGGEEPVGAVGREESGGEEPVGAVGRGESGEEEPVGTVGREESGEEEPVGAVGREESGEEEPVGAVGREESGEECGVREKEVAGEGLPAENTVQSQAEEPQANHGPVNLEEFGSAAELEVVGGDRLKHVLQSMGFKCGGTVRERAETLLHKGQGPIRTRPLPLCQGRQTEEAET